MNTAAPAPHGQKQHNDGSTKKYNGEPVDMGERTINAFSEPITPTSPLDVDVVALKATAVPFAADPR